MVSKILNMLFLSFFMFVTSLFGDTKPSNAETTQKIIISKEVFFDKSTRLTWQDNYEVKTMKKDWQGAKDYCENLTLAGHSDWRLPTKEELASLSTLGFYGDFNADWEAWFDVNMVKQINNSFANPVLKNTDLFYWSSSEDVSDSTKSWFVNYYRGGSYKIAKTGSTNVRCVLK